MGHGILLIEDEQIFANHIKGYLERRGYRTVTAGTGEGLELFSKCEIDLVLLDINPPDLHGLKVLQEIRRRDQRVKLICMSASGHVQVAIDAMKAGTHHYVSKPVRLSELKMLIETALSPKGRGMGAMDRPAAPPE